MKLGCKLGIVAALIFLASLSTSAAEMATLRLERAPFHGEWNYTILPRTA